MSGSLLPTMTPAVRPTARAMIRPAILTFMEVSSKNKNSIKIKF